MAKIYGLGKKQARKKTHKELGQSLLQLEEQLSKRLDALDQALKVVGRSVQTLWANQKELTASQNLLDEQFAVSTRMSIMGINLLLGKVEAEERLDAEDIEQLFKDWATFRTRPDFRDLMMPWMLGVPLKDLPAPPEPKAKKEGETDAESDNGDAVPEEGQSEDSPPGETDDVPEVQQENRASD